MISADRIKSVRMAPVTMSSSAVGAAWASLPRMLPQTFWVPVAQVDGADHQERGQQPRRELTEQHCGGQDHQELVTQGSDRDAFDDRQFTLGGDYVDVLRCHRGVVDDHSGGLGGRASGGSGQSCEALSRWWAGPPRVVWLDRWGEHRSGVV